MKELQVSETYEMTAEALAQPHCRQLVSMGGSRSSKSYSILQWLMIQLMTRRRIKITAWRNTKVTCRQTILEDFENIIMFDPVVYKKFKQNKQSGTFTYKPTGSKIVFEGADSIGKVLGGAQHISFFNEVTEFNKDVYKQIRQRTSDQVIVDYNPSKTFFIENYREDKETIFIRSNFMNNAYCSEQIVKDLLAYEPWLPGSYEVRGDSVYYNGAPISPKNQPPPHPENTKKQTADEFYWLVYGLGLKAEKPNKIYRGWIQITDDEFDQIDSTSYFGIDFGTANPTACVEVKYDGDRTFFLRERLYMPLQSIDDSLPTVMKLRVKSCVPGRNLLIGDSAKKKYIDTLLNEGYVAQPAEKGNGSVEAGIALVQSFTICYVPTKHLLNEYDVYEWSTDRAGNLLDVPVKKDDHLMDATRYIITYLYKYLGIKI